MSDELSQGRSKLSWGACAERHPYWKGEKECHTRKQESEKEWHTLKAHHQICLALGLARRQRVLQLRKAALLRRGLVSVLCCVSGQPERMQGRRRTLGKGDLEARQAALSPPQL